jgi:hypothetical protein
MHYKLYAVILFKISFKVTLETPVKYFRIFGLRVLKVGVCPQVSYKKRGVKRTHIENIKKY